jgi:hypothetical protein
LPTNDIATTLARNIVSEASQRKRLREDLVRLSRRIEVARDELEQRIAAKDERIARIDGRVQSLQERRSSEAAERKKLAGLRPRLESMLEGIRADSEAAGLPLPERTPHSTRGRVGIRAPILQLLRDAEDGTAPIEVTRRLLELGVAASAGHVSRTMARMARDGELERLGYGLYCLPREDK